MGVYCTLHCEAYIGNQWSNIDLRYFPYCRGSPAANTQVLPVLEGLSAVHSVLQCSGLLSTPIDTSDVSPLTRACHPTEYPQHQSWRVFDYRAFFHGKNFSVPEYAAYFPNDVYHDFLSSGETEPLETAFYTEVALSPHRFAHLTPEAQQGYHYLEFTQPFSHHDVLRQIQQNVTQALRPYPSFSGPIRIVVYLG